MVDARGREAYRARVDELQAEIEDARRANDPVREERARDELGAIAEALDAAYGLGGRVRRAGDPAERARTAVAWRVRSAVGKIDAENDALARHLRNAVRMGTWCADNPRRRCAGSSDAGERQLRWVRKRKAFGRCAEITEGRVCRPQPNKLDTRLIWTCRSAQRTPASPPSAVDVRPCNRAHPPAYPLSTDGQQGGRHDRTAHQDVPARPPRGGGAGLDRPPAPGACHARPSDGARRARGGRDRGRLRPLQPRPRWLWAASGLLVVHWFGDSLDGTLARVRRSERPRYGYYLDHLVDAIATALIGIGLGVSPYMLLITGLVIVIAYLVLSINTYLETQALGVFSLGYGRLGPTEARAGLIVVNTLLALGVAPAISIFGLGITVLDVVALGAAGAMLVALGVRAARNLRELARREPAQRPAAHAAP